MVTAEERRLEESASRTAHWKRWGPYVSERAWGTVREDYSADGDAWEYFPHEQARSRAYRWNEDGLAGICDRHQYICFALALWNGVDPILKERAFGLTGTQGNHGEDPKEHYFYLDSTPTHSYMRYLYKYPQRAFPYEELVEENQRRGRRAPEYQLLDTGVFDGDRYFDVFVEYAKGSPEDILCRITVVNRGPEAAHIDLLPTVWFRNTWSWGRDNGPRPKLRRSKLNGAATIELLHPALGPRLLAADGSPELLFVENDTNMQRLFGEPDETPFTKDGIGEWIVHGTKATVNPAQEGTKASAHYRLKLGAGESAEVRLRLTDTPPDSGIGSDFDRVFQARVREADEFYATVIPESLSADAKSVMRQSFAGLLWSKQFYHYVVKEWLEGDPAYPPTPKERLTGRNSTWLQLYNADVISMPDKWDTPGTQHGISPSTASRWHLSTRTSRRSSSRCCSASGTCTRTANCRRTSGRWAT